MLPEAVNYAESALDAIRNADAAFIVTEWEEICSLSTEQFKENLKIAVIFDGRNCFNIETMKSANLDYFSIGRPIVKTQKEFA